METLNFLSPLGVVATARTGNAICERLRGNQPPKRFPMATRAYVERYGASGAIQLQKQLTGCTEQDAVAYVQRVMTVKPGDDTVLPIIR